MRNPGAAGLTLAEILISLTLIGTIGLCTSIYALKLLGNNDSNTKLSQADTELNSLEENMRFKLENAGWIDAASFNKQIVFTTLDSSGNASKVGYRITASGSQNVLEYSKDGTTWGTSPYAISGNVANSANYNIDSGEFLYCGYGNNCTRFTDTDADGQWETGEGRTQVSGTILLNTPSEAQKVIISGFTFNRQTGNPVVKRTWPDMIVHLPEQQVSTSTTLLQQFSTVPGATNNFSSGLNVTGIAFHPGTHHLIAVGGDTTGTDNFIYQLTRDGVPSVAVTDTGNIEFDDVCADADGISAWTVQWGATTTLKRFNLNIGSGTAFDTITFTATAASYFGAGGSATAIACDPGTTNTVYILGKTSGGVQSIVPVTLDTSADTATPGTRISLPTAMNSGTTEALIMDPETDDFYALQQAMSGSDPNKLMTIYHIANSSPTTSDPFTINISNLKNPSPASASGWGMAYDYENNHLFIVDSTTDLIYEFAPPRLLSPKT